MFAKVISYNMQFKSAKPVKPVYGLTHCYGDRPLACLCYKKNPPKKYNSVSYMIYIYDVK